jgi:hypothetical protein
MNIRQHGRHGRMACATPHTFECLPHQSSLPVLVCFQARKAGSMIPALRRSSRAFTGRPRVVHVNVTDYPNLAERFKVRVIPILLLFEHGVPVRFLVGILLPRFVFETVRKLVDRPLPVDLFCLNSQRATRSRALDSRPRDRDPPPILGPLTWRGAGRSSGALTVGGCRQLWLRGVSRRSWEGPMASARKEAKLPARRVLRRQQRTCLRCDRTFMSAGSHNRLCDPCRGVLTVASTPEEEYSMAFLKASSTGRRTEI